MSKRYFAVQQLDRKADIYIFGDIVPFELFPGEVSANSLVQQIKSLDVDEIHVHIDSYGGAVSEGWGIYNALINHPARIVTYGDGFVASAALYPFLAGDERYASTLSAYYFHQVMTSAAGYAEDLRAAADEAEVLTGIGVNAFVERTSLREDEVRALMEKETWLTPDQALDAGVATAIVMDAGPKYAQDAKRKFFQRVFSHSNSAGQALPPEPTPKQAPAQSPIMKLFENFDF